MDSVVSVGNVRGRAQTRHQELGRSRARTFTPLPLLIVLALLIPQAMAAAPDAPTALVVMEEAGAGSWNGESVVSVTTSLASRADEEVRLWVPIGARIHVVETSRTDAEWRAASWEVAGPDSLRVPLDGATQARARYDWAPSPHEVARIVTPQDYSRLEVALHPTGGKVAQSPDAEVTRGAILLTDVDAGRVLVLRAVDADRIGELPILLAVLGISALVLLAGIAWHHARPPLEGREPERFMDHLGELQSRLMPPALAFGLLNLYYFGAGLRLVRVSGWTLVAPTFGTASSLSARAFAAFAERLVPAGVQLVALRPVEAVLVQVQVALFLATASVLPLLLYEVAAFLSPALLPRERRVATTTLPLVGGLLLAGALFGYLVMSPFMIRTLYGYAPTLGAVPLLAVGDLVSFTLLIVTAFGIAFELPVLMYALSRLGIVKAATFRRYFRHAVVGIAIVSGIVTPDPSVVSLLVVALPVTGLYTLGMGAAAWGEKRRERVTDARQVAAG